MLASCTRSHIIQILQMPQVGNFRGVICAGGIEQTVVGALVGERTVEVAVGAQPETGGDGELAAERDGIRVTE